MFLCSCPFFLLRFSSFFLCCRNATFFFAPSQKSRGMTDYFLSGVRSLVSTSPSAAVGVAQVTGITSRNLFKFYNPYFPLAPIFRVSLLTREFDKKFQISTHKTACPGPPTLTSHPSDWTYEKLNAMTSTHLQEVSCQICIISNTLCNYFFVGLQ